MRYVEGRISAHGSLVDNDATSCDREWPQYPPDLLRELVDYVGPRAGVLESTEAGLRTEKAGASLPARAVWFATGETGENLAASLRKFAT